MVKFEDLLERKRPIAVVGLGYVGLPLAVALSAHMDVTGFDVNPKRIAELVRGEDHTRETLPEELAGAKIDYTDDPARLAQAAVISRLLFRRAASWAPICPKAAWLSMNRRSIPA